MTLDEGTVELARRGWALAVHVRSAETQLIWEETWLDYSIEEREEGGLLELHGLEPLTIPEGPYEIEVTLKSEDLNLTPHDYSPQRTYCPEPATLSSPLLYAQFDLAQGLWKGSLNRDQTLEIPLLTQTCGPGDLRTSLKGKIELPSSLSPLSAQQLMIHLKPTGDESEGRAPISFPLSPYLGATVDDEPRPFFMNSLPEGEFELIVFADSDGDHLPTPCDRVIGMGGDLWIGADEASRVTFKRGELTTLETPLGLSAVEECLELDVSQSYNPENLDPEIPLSSDRYAVFIGQIDLSDELLTALALSTTRELWFSATRRGLAPSRFISGKPLFTLSQALISNGRFSIHLPLSSLQEPTSLAIWIDEGSDQSLTPCDDPADRGGDLWLWTGDSTSLSVQQEPSILLSTPSTQINIARRCDAPVAIAEINFEFNFSWPDRVGARPLILVSEDLETGEVIETTILDLTAGTLPRSYLLSHRQQPGRYWLSAYLDQDLDHQFLACSDRFLGDRISTTRGTPLAIQSGDLRQVTLSLAPRECPFLETSALLQVWRSLGDQEDKPELRSIHLGEEPIGACPAGTLLISTFEEDPFTNPDRLMTSLRDQRCLTPDQQNQISELSGGRYRMISCGRLSENLSIEDFSLGEDNECLFPSYWVAEVDVILNELPQQTVDLEYHAACRCPLEN